MINDPLTLYKQVDSTTLLAGQSSVQHIVDIKPSKKNMLINGTIVNQTKTEKGIQYEYFACQCKEEDKAFLDGLLNKQRTKTDFEGDYLTTRIICDLMCESWYVKTIFVDQWAVITLANEDHNDTMRIQCDIIEHGLAVAELIACNLAEE